MRWKGKKPEIEHKIYRYRYRFKTLCFSFKHVKLVFFCLSFIDFSEQTPKGMNPANAVKKVIHATNKFKVIFVCINFGESFFFFFHFWMFNDLTSFCSFTRLLNLLAHCRFTFKLQDLFYSTARGLKK